MSQNPDPMMQPPMSDQAWHPPSVPPPPLRPAQKSGPSCLVIGLIGCGTVAVLGIIVVIVAVFAVRHFVTGLVESYTEAAPMALPQVTLSQEECAEIKTRVDAFFRDVESGKEAAPLILNGDDINALILADPDLSKLKDKVYVGIEGDELRAEVSVPIDEFLPSSITKGRYFNGKAAFDVYLEGGRLQVFVASAEMKGQPLPEQIMSQVSGKNLAEDPEMSKSWKDYESIKIQDGRLVITPKKLAKAPAATDATPAEKAEAEKPAGEAAATEAGEAEKAPEEAPADAKAGAEKPAEAAPEAEGEAGSSADADKAAAEKDTAEESTTAAKKPAAKATAKKPAAKKKPDA